MRGVGLTILNRMRYWRFRLPSSIKPVRSVKLKIRKPAKAVEKYEYLVKQRIPKNCLKTCS